MLSYCKRCSISFLGANDQRNSVQPWVSRLVHQVLICSQQVVSTFFRVIRVAKLRFVKFSNKIVYRPILCQPVFGVMVKY